MRKYFILYSGNTLQLDKKRQYFVGRDPECDIRFEHQTVSRKHGIITWEHRGFQIRDLHSTNGIFLNTERINYGQLHDKDKIQVGMHYLEYREMEAAVNYKGPPQASDTILLEKKVDAIIHSLDDPVLSEEIMGLKHYIHKKSEQLSSLAYADKLTGLYNRRAFDEKVNSEKERAIRYRRELSLMMIDIDHFKQFNDTYGHQKGDAVLQIVADIITRALRKTDIAARYGGEELSIILPETNLTHSCQLAEKIRTSIQAQSLNRLGMAVTVSIGVACLNNRQQTAEALIAAADAALYQAKARGRNRCECTP